MKWNKDKHVEIVTSMAQCREVISRIASFPLIAVDTETTGLQRFAEVVGVSIAVSEDEGYYFPIKVYSVDKGLVSPWSPNDLAELKKLLVERFTQSNEGLIMFNSPFDAKVINNTFGVEVIDKVVSDPQLLKHTCISEDKPRGLKPISAIYLDPDAESSQEDLKESVLTNGGSWTKENKEMYKGDYRLLGTYAVYDTLYTYGLHNRFYPEIEKQGMQELWYKEVLPLNRVTYDLNTVGVRLDVPYFEALKIEMSAKVGEIEDELYELLKKDLLNYEINRILLGAVITKRTALGKFLMEKGITDFTSFPSSLAVEWYLTKYKTRRVINFNSNADKAFIFFNILGFTSTVKTKSGGDSLTADTIYKFLSEVTGVDEDVLGEMSDDELKDLCSGSDLRSRVLYLFISRALETKILSTYVIPFLEQHIDGRLYPSFNQAGTTTARYSSSSPNFQNLPSTDKRIRKGIIADEGEVFVDDDYESLEPKVFAHVSNSDSIKEIYTKNLDFYSKVYLDVMGDNGMSADKKADNYLGNINKDLRTNTKPWSLGFAYGLQEYKLAKMLKITIEEAKIYRDRYFVAYPELLNFHKECRGNIKTKGYVQNLIGRKRRTELTPKLYAAGVKSFDYATLQRSASICVRVSGLPSVKDVAKKLGNEERNAYNFPIQSLAAATVNAACIAFYDKSRQMGLKAKICLQVHDQITVACPISEKEVVSKLLQESMENNWVTEKLSVKMKAIPVVVTRWSDAK